jgi:hypothetical protein
VTACWHCWCRAHKGSWWWFSESSLRPAPSLSSPSLGLFFRVSPDWYPTRGQSASLPALTSATRGDRL